MDVGITAGPHLDVVWHQPPSWNWYTLVSSEGFNIRGLCMLTDPPGRRELIKLFHNPAEIGEGGDAGILSGGLRGTPLGREIRDALAHLNDPPYLETSPLIYLVTGDSGTSPFGRGVALQRHILQAIEALQADPSAPAPAAVAAERRHRLLCLRYIEMRDVEEVCARLAISQRKYYVEHVLGVKAVISLLTNPEPPQELSSLLQPSKQATSHTPWWERTHSGEAAPPNPLVGRANELALLTSIYETVVAEHRERLVLINGEVGVGKTRLARMLAAYARSRRATVLEAKYSGVGEAPYAPWTELLRAGLRSIPREDVTGYLAGLVADLRWLLPELSGDRSRSRPPSLFSREEEQARLYVGIGAALRMLSTRAPLVIFLDDLHLAPGLGVLSHVTSHLADCPVLLLLSYRERELVRQAVLARDLASLDATAGYTSIPLGPLTRAETVQMLATAFGEQPAMQLSAAVYGTTRGNPLFIEETVRSLIERRIVRATSSGWECADPDAVTVPGSVILSIEERVARLGPRGRKSLEQAAVLGRNFALDVLSRLSRPDDRTLWSEVERAVAAGILLDRSTPGNDRYVFADNQVQEVLYAGLPEDLRRRYHVEAARAMEELYHDDRDDRAGEIAQHLAFSPEPEDLARAVQYLQTAAHRAAEVYAYSSAARLLERALESEKHLPPDPSRRCDLLLALAAVLGPEGDPSQIGEEIAKEALQLAQTLEDDERARRACRAGLEAVFRYGSWMAPTTALYRDWVLRAERHAIPGTYDRIYCDAASAWVKWSHGQWAEATEEFVRVWEQARELGDPQARFEVAAIVLSVSPAPSYFAWHRSVAEELRTIPRQRVHPRTLATALRHAGSILLQTGDRTGAEALWDELRELAARTRDVYALLYPFSQQGILALLDGHLDQAVEIGRRLVGYADRSGMPAVGRLLAVNQTFGPMCLLGATDEALTFLQRHAPPFDSDQQAPSPIMRGYETISLAELGRHQEARTMLDQLFEQLHAAVESQLAPAAVLAFMLDAAVRLRDREKVAVLMQSLEGTEASHLAPAGYVSVARLLGDGLLLLGDVEEARFKYAQGLRECSAIAHRPETAVVHLHLGLLLLQHRDSERASAIAHLDFAVTQFREMQMKPALERALREREWLLSGIAR